MFHAHTNTKNEFVRPKLNATRALYLIRCIIYCLNINFKRIPETRKEKNIITCNWTMDHKLLRRYRNPNRLC